MIRFGSTEIATHVFFAPLSGCSDLAFRLIARECGARFCFFEMIDAHSLVNPNPKRFNILRTVAADAPIAAQLVGVKPAMLRDAAHILLDHASVTFLDLNSACPVKKVVKKGAGASLLTTPDLLAELIETLASSVEVPVTVKLRIGYHRTNIPDLIDLVKLCEASGAAGLFVHGRTREQGYSGDINYEAIRAVKQAVRIPVIGSGNIFGPFEAKQMLDTTGCDGVLVARGAFGNPWIFRDIEDFLRHGTLPPDKTIITRKIVLKRHLAYIAQYKTNSPAGKIGFMRKIALWYIRGFHDASKLRGQVNAIPDYESLLRFIDDHL